MFDLSKPLWINWELNNICNLMCPQCGRNDIVDGKLVFKKSAAALNNHDNSLETFKKVYNNIEYPIEKISFQGHVSENVASKDFLEICDFVISKGTRIHISTNGSLRSKKWWYELGKIFSLSSTSKCYFSLDGMGPELGIYRVGANYDKVIENAVAFIDGGGRAYWRMIIFKHNQHQIEDAKKEADRLGFYDFVTTHTNRRYLMNTPYEYKGKTYVLENQDMFPEWNKRVEENKKYFEDSELEEISCKAINENQFYIDYTNKVWACYYIPNKNKLSHEQDWYKEYHEDNSNNLEEKTFNQIINNKFYSALEMSWDLDNKCLSSCKNSCSIKRGINRAFQYKSGKVLKNVHGGEIQSHVEEI